MQLDFYLIIYYAYFISWEFLWGPVNYKYTLLDFQILLFVSGFLDKEPQYGRETGWGWSFLSVNRIIV